MAILCIISCLIKDFKEAYANRAPLTAARTHGTDEKEYKKENTTKSVLVVHIGRIIKPTLFLSHSFHITINQPIHL